MSSTTEIEKTRDSLVVGAVAGEVNSCINYHFYLFSLIKLL